MYYFWHEMVKIVSVSAGGAYDAPQAPSRDGLLAFGNRSFVPSALAISTSPLRTVYLPPTDSNLTP